MSQNYGDKIVYKNEEAKETEVTLKPVEKTDEPIEAIEVIHVTDFNKDGPDLAFVGTDCGIFVIDTKTGMQKAHYLEISEKLINLIIKTNLCWSDRLHRASQ